MAQLEVMVEHQLLTLCRLGHKAVHHSARRALHYGPKEPLIVPPVLVCPPQHAAMLAIIAQQGTTA